jgi:hypothetical protein
VLLRPQFGLAFVNRCIVSYVLARSIKFSQELGAPSIIIGREAVNHLSSNRGCMALFLAGTASSSSSSSRLSFTTAI